MASTSTYKTDPTLRRTPPTLLTLPPELRTQIVTNVLRLDCPLKPACPYYRAYHGIMCISTLMWWKMLKYPSDPTNPTRPEENCVRYRPDARDSKPPWWSLLVVNKQLYAECAGMIVERNTVHFDSVQCAECFRRDHPFPIPERTIWKSPLRPKRDMLGVRTMALDIFSLWHLPITNQGEARKLARCIRPFKELRTLFLVVKCDSPCYLQLFDWVLKELEAMMEIEADTFFSHDCLPQEATRAKKTTTGKLRVGFVGTERAAWTCGMPVAAVQACADVTRKEEVFYP